MKVTYNTSYARAVAEGTIKENAMNETPKQPAASLEYSQAVKENPAAFYPGKPAPKVDPLADEKHAAFVAGHPIARTGEERE